jgi:hypothetical protein
VITEIFISADGDRLISQSLDDEVRDHAPVVGVHARPVGVEDAGDLDASAVLTAVIEEERLGLLTEL